jgi:hypothetical protein
MVCLVCRKKIGLFRRLRDREFCCEDHRRKSRIKSARALRDCPELWGEEEPWPVDLRVYAKKSVKPANPFVRLAAIPFTLLILVAVWLVPTVVVEGPVKSYIPSADHLQGVFGKAILGLQTHRVREDFRSGIKDWWGGPGSSGTLSGWTTQVGAVRPGRLRLWSRSMAMVDYQLEFEGEIEQKAMGWAFRAQDHGNYYATKIAAARPASDARIVRMVMQNGVVVNKVQLPSPVPILEHTAYRVRVSVKGNRYNTLINGQMVDSWTDSRFRSGGVGFFAEQGEVAALRWVSITDRESLLDRIFTASFLIPPVCLAGCR